MPKDTLICVRKGLLSNPQSRLILQLMTDIQQNLNLVLKNIADACIKGQRNPSEVALVAVSKTHPADAVEQALQSGQRVFGENRVQEALAKFPLLKQAHPDLELHLIGPIQTNKVSDAIRLFDVIETLDRPKLAQAIALEAQKQGRCPPFSISRSTRGPNLKKRALPYKTSKLSSFLPK